jgi:thymidylate kinase
MLIILEGQRNVGKTTVIDAFIAQNSVRTSPFWGYNVKKFVIERKQYPVVSMMRDWLPLCFDRSTIWLLDRGSVTEQVYTELTGRKVTWTQQEMAWAEYFLSLGGPLMFYLKCDAEVLMQRQLATGKPSEGDICEISRLFDIYVKRTPLTNYTIDVTGRNVDSVVKIIENYSFSVFANRKEIP